MAGSDYEYLGPELTKLVLNPLLVKKFGFCFFDTGPAFGYQRGADCFYMLPWSPNRRELITWNRRNTTPLLQVGPPKQLDEASSQLGETSRARFTTRGASWRRMVVSQPAPPGVGYLMHELSRELQSPKERIGEAFIPAVTTGGVQMGQLYDMVQYHAGHHKTGLTNFRVIWELTQTFQTQHLREPIRQLLGQTTLLVLFAFSHFLYFEEPKSVVILTQHSSARSSPFLTLLWRSPYVSGALKKTRRVLSHHRTNVLPYFYSSIGQFKKTSGGTELCRK